VARKISFTLRQSSCIEGNVLTVEVKSVFVTDFKVINCDIFYRSITTVLLDYFNCK